MGLSGKWEAVDCQCFSLNGAPDECQIVEPGNTKNKKI